MLDLYEGKVILLLSNDGLNMLKTAGIVRKTPEGYYEPLHPFLFKPQFEETAVESWIDEWQELFPKGLNRIAGRPYRGPRTDCLMKMKAFILRTNYSKDLIFKATKLFLSVALKQSHQFIPQSHYFIQKLQKGSDLEAYCQMIINGETEGGRVGTTAL